MSKLSKHLFLLACIVCISFNHASAGQGFDKLVKDVFPSGTMSNSTSSAIVREQSAGHYIGGSAVIKAPANPPLRPIQARAPSCKMGGLPCGAQFEMIGGAVSLVSGQELVDYLKSLPQHAATYGSMMAIKTLCPQCQDLLEWLSAQADTLNQLSLDHCKMTQDLIDPLFPKQAAKETALRQSNSVLNGDKKDMGQIQKESKKGDIDHLNPELESQLGDNYNLVWKALAEKLKGSGDDAGFKELLMSISGTIIGKKDAEGRMTIRHIKSLVTKDLIRELIGFDGVSKSKVKLFKCDENSKCIDPKAIEQEVTQGAFLYNRVKEIMTGIIQKISRDDEKLNEKEEAFIALSSDQIIPKIENDLILHSDPESIIASQRLFIEVLTFDVVTNYLQELLASVQEAVGELSHSQMGDADKFRDFALETREVMRMLETARKEARQKYELIQNSKTKLNHEKKAQDMMIEKYFSKQARK